MPRTLRLLRVERERTGERRWVRPRQDGERLDAVGMVRGGEPCDLATPVVTHEVEGLGAQRIREVEHIGDEPRRRVGGDVLRSHAGRVAALIGSDRVETGGGERRHDVTPREARLREPVQQQHEWGTGRASDISEEGALRRQDRGGRRIHSRSVRCGVAADRVERDLSDRLVDALNGAYGVHPGHRAAHAKGVLCAATFTASEAGGAILEGSALQRRPCACARALLERCGRPDDPRHDPRRVQGIAVKLYLPDGTTTDVIGITLPVFFTRTPEDLIEFNIARRPDPETGAIDLAKVGAFLERHPETVPAVTAAMTLPLPTSYALCLVSRAPHLQVRQPRRSRDTRALPLRPGGR